MSRRECRGEREEGGGGRARGEMRWQCPRVINSFQQENVRMLIPYIVENFGDMMKSVTYVDVFKQLLNKYEQLLEAETRKTGTDKIVTTNG